MVIVPVSLPGNFAFSVFCTLKTEQKDDDDPISLHGKQAVNRRHQVNIQFRHLCRRTTNGGKRPKMKPHGARSAAWAQLCINAKHFQ